MKIKLTSVYVNDQDKALRFYTEVLGFAKKADFSNDFVFVERVGPETERNLLLESRSAARRPRRRRGHRPVWASAAARRSSNIRHRDRGKRAEIGVPAE